MNERIKQLAFEAANGMLSYDGEGEWRLSQKEVEKFAELIVRECATHIISSSDRYRREYFAEKILKHFGVDK
jgi:hypothetical protein